MVWQRRPLIGWLRPARNVSESKWIMRMGVVCRVNLVIWKSKTLDWYQTFIAGRRLASLDQQSLINIVVYRKPRDDQVKRTHASEQQERSHQLVKFTDQFLALLVMVLTKAGLCEVRPYYDKSYVTVESRLSHAFSKKRMSVQVFHERQCSYWLRSLPLLTECYLWTLLLTFRYPVPSSPIFYTTLLTAIKFRQYLEYLLWPLITEMRSIEL